MLTGQDKGGWVGFKLGVSWRVFVLFGRGGYSVLLFKMSVSWLTLHCCCIALESVMLLFFVVQVVLVTFESVFKLRSGVWCIGIEVVLSPLFVMPVLFFTDPAVMMMEK